MIEEYFKNKYNVSNGVHIIDIEDNYTENFGKQWKKYNFVQVDKKNNFNISEDFIKRILFNNITIIKDKKVLELGCGAGRFTEHIIKYAKLCVSVDMSSAIFFNVEKNSDKLLLVKADFTKLVPNEKFDVVICRGVLQHTPDPFLSLLKMQTFLKDNGDIFFDIYPKPKLRYLHPKYFFWRPLFQNLVNYNLMDSFLDKNITFLLKIKRYIKNITRSNFISDSIVPIWDYKNRINLTDKQLEEWAKLDTLDGLYAKYDNPKSYKEIIKFLFKNNLRLINHNIKENCFHIKIK